MQFRINFLNLVLILGIPILGVFELVAVGVEQPKRTLDSILHPMVESYSLKGDPGVYAVEQYIRPQFRNILSPSIANILLQGRSIGALYQLKSKEESKKPGKLSPKDPTNLNSDPVVNLVQKLFWMIPGDDQNLLVSKAPQIFTSHLEPSTIGKLIKAVHLDQIEDPTKLSRLVEEDVLKNIPLSLGQQILNAFQSEEIDLPIAEQRKLANLSFEGLVFLQKRLEQEASTLETFKAPLKRKKADLAETCTDPGSIEVAKDLFSTLSNLKQTLSQEIETDTELNLRQKKWRRIQKQIKIINRTIDPYKAGPFVDIFLAAIKQCKEAESIYPRNFPYQLLQAYLLLKSKNVRSSLFEEFKQIDPILSEAGKRLVSENTGPHRNDDFWQPRLNSEIFEQLVSQLTHENMSVTAKSTFQEDILTTSLFKNTIGTFNGQVFNQGIGDVNFRIGVDGPETSSSDCCEASFLNFFSQFVVHSAVPENARNRSRFETLFSYENFYKLTPRNTEVRRTWKEITSNLPGISYLQEKKEGNKLWKFDMQPSVDNFIALVEHFVIIPKEKGLAQPTRTQKLKTICLYLGCTVDIKSGEEPMANMPWKNAKIQFVSSLKGQPPLDINIEPNHCFAEVKEPPRTTSLDQFLRKRVLNLVQREKEPSGYMDDDALVHMVSQSMSTSCAKEEIQFWISKFNNERFRRNLLPLILSCPLDSAQSVEMVVQLVFKNRLSGYYPIALKLINSLPLDFYRMKNTILIYSQFAPAGLASPSIANSQVFCGFKASLQRVLSAYGQLPLAYKTGESEITAWVQMVQNDSSWNSKQCQGLEN